VHAHAIPRAQRRRERERGACTAISYERPPSSASTSRHTTMPASAGEASTAATRASARPISTAAPIFALDGITLRRYCATML